MKLRDIQQDFNRNFKKIGSLLGSLTEDLTGSLNQDQLRRILSSALDWLRPYHLAIGFRVRKLSRSQVEAVIPDRAHNLNSKGEIEEAVAISVAIQMAKLLMARWEVPVAFELDQVRFERLQALKGEVVARLEWEDLAREALRAEVLQQSVGLNEFYIHLYDAEEKRIADIQVVLKVSLPESLGGKGSHGDHSERN